MADVKISMGGGVLDLEKLAEALQGPNTLRFEKVGYKEYRSFPLGRIRRNEGGDRVFSRTQFKLIDATEENVGRAIYSHCHSITESQNYFELIIQIKNYPFNVCIKHPYSGELVEVNGIGKKHKPVDNPNLVNLKSRLDKLLSEDQLFIERDYV
ncbi:MAG: hypothetical protein KJ674_01265 [Nanoarchaeota archaeon]|nr:hypothetical protein [Nanoarchaeota archaeon]